MYIGIVTTTEQPFPFTITEAFVASTTGGSLNDKHWISFSKMDANRPLTQESGISDFNSSTTLSVSVPSMVIATWMANDFPDTLKSIVLCNQDSANRAPLPSNFDVVCFDCALEAATGGDLLEAPQRIIMSVRNAELSLSLPTGLNRIDVFFPEPVSVLPPAPAPDLAPASEPTPVLEPVASTTFRAVVTQVVDTGNILNIDNSAKSIEFVGQKTNAFLADVTVSNDNQDVISVVKVHQSSTVQALLHIAPLSYTTTPTDKSALAEVKKKQKIGVLLTIQDNLLLLLKSKAAVDYVDSRLAALAEVDNSDIYGTARLLGLSNELAAQICSIYSVLPNSRGYLAEEQLQIAETDISLLAKMLTTLKAKGVALPPLTPYIESLRDNRDVMATVADCGLKIKAAA